MVKGIVSAFDHMGFCLVLNLKTTFTDGKWAVIWPPNFATKYVSFGPTFTLWSKYLLPAKKLIPSTVVKFIFSGSWRSLSSFCIVLKTTGPSCSKLTTSLVNISWKFQTLISKICQYFLLKKHEKLLQQCKSFSHFFNKKYQCFWL